MARLVAPQGATSAFAIHLAREGRLAWASTQIRMWADWNMGGWGVSRVGVRRQGLPAESTRHRRNQRVSGYRGHREGHE